MPRRKLAGLGLVAFVVGLGFGRASVAGLFISADHNGTPDNVVITSMNPSGDSFGPYPVGFDVPFFGVDTTGATLSLNSSGNLTFAQNIIGPPGDTTTDETGFPGAAGFQRIAPFFDYLFLPNPGGSFRINTQDAGTYVAIWDHVTTGTNPTPQSITAEAVVFGAGNPYGLAAGTIVLSYGDVTGTDDGTVTVGLENGDETNYVSLFNLPTPIGDSTGVLNDAQSVSLSNRTFTFTPNGRTYDVAEFTPTLGPPTTTGVPEPSTIGTAILGLALCGMIVGRRRRASGI